MTQKSMVKSKIIRIRFKPEIETALRNIMKIAPFDDISKTVRHLVETGLNFYQERKKVIVKLKEQIGIFTIKPEELYPDIKIKRKYLGR